MFKLYRKSQDTQLNWIRNHPVQYVTLNAVLIGAFFGYLEYKAYREKRKFENIVDQLED